MIPSHACGYRHCFLTQLLKADPNTPSTVPKSRPKEAFLSSPRVRITTVTTINSLVLFSMAFIASPPLPSVPAPYSCCPFLLRSWPNRRSPSSLRWRASFRPSRSPRATLASSSGGSLSRAASSVIRAVRGSRRRYRPTSKVRVSWHRVLGFPSFSLVGIFADDFCLVWVRCICKRRIWRLWLACELHLVTYLRLVDQRGGLKRSKNRFLCIDHTMS